MGPAVLRERAAAALAEANWARHAPPPAASSPPSPPTGFFANDLEVFRADLYATSPREGREDGLHLHGVALQARATEGQTQDARAGDVRAHDGWPQELRVPDARAHEVRAQDARAPE